MAMFLNEMGVDPRKHFSKLTFSGSHEASILAVANKRVDVAATNLPDMTQLVRENKVPRTSLRVIWVSRLIPTTRWSSARIFPQVCAPPSRSP